MQTRLFLDTKTRQFYPPRISGPSHGAYYQDMLLKQEMLPDICAISGDFFIFQQHSAPTGS